MTNTCHEVIKQGGQQTPGHELGQRAGQTRLHLTEAFLGTQRLAQCIKHDGKAEEQDDAGDTMQDGRVRSDGELDGP
ncbi:hypothetical protein D3C75_784970 [compost metagenome]